MELVSLDCPSCEEHEKRKKKKKRKGTLGGTVDLVCVIMRLGLLQSHVAHPPGMIVHGPGVGCCQKSVEH